MCRYYVFQPFVLAHLAFQLNNNTAQTEFSYSITPTKTPDVWKSLQTHDEMVKACKIPDEILKQMTTPQLLKVCIDYPLFADMFTFNSIEAGFTSVSRSFNGLQELLSRKDFATEMVKYYQNMNLEEFKNETYLQYFKLRYICVLLSQKQTLQSLSPAEYEIIVSTSRNILDKISNTSYYNTDELNDLITLVLMKSTTPSSSAVLRDSAATLYTPKGTAVNAINITSELTAQEKQAWRDWIAANYPNAIIVSDASKRYNCHSYAWYSQSTSNHYWINAPEQQKYWLDGSYKKIASYNGGTWPSGITHGVVVDYVNDDHSARVFSSTQIISKWGQGPVVRHPFRYCPYNSSAANFYDLNY